MKQFLVVGALAFLGSPALAQVMPGTPVGTPLVSPVGTQLPQAGTKIPKVGTPPPGYGGLTSGNAYTPPASPVDPKLVIAPYPTTSPVAAPTSFWDGLTNRWFAMFGLGTPIVDQRNWTPGLGRRSKARKDAMWVRD